LIPSSIVFAYLAIVIYIGVFAFRQAKGKQEVEEYFLASRSLGPFVFLMSLFGTNMTAFAILGSSGHAFNNGIVTYGLMASSSALVIPLTLFLIGTRVWALGRKHGFITPVQIFRDRWECSHIGTLICLVQALFLVPYIVIGVMGGGTTLSTVSGGLVPYWFGGAVVAVVVMIYVFFGGMRGTALVNTFQTTLFLLFGALAVVVIGYSMGGFRTSAEAMLASPLSFLLTRERISPLYFFSYTFIPLSTIAFPHITMFCLTARRMAQFKKTVVFYPLCLMAVWLPSVFLGVMANRVTDIPELKAKVEARTVLAAEGRAMTPAQRDVLRAEMGADDVLLLLLQRYAPVWLAGILGAGIMAAVMATDSQILALSTMFAEDVFAHYGGKERFGAHVQVQVGRLFVVALTVVAYAVALKAPESIFSLAIQYAFTGFAALSPLLVAALFWRGSTKWGALAATTFVAAAVSAVAIFQAAVPAPAPGPPLVVAKLGGLDVLTRTPGGTAIFGFMPVVPMVLLSSALMVVVSWMTPKPSRATLERYFADASFS
jgi:SSS family solute:Na+ symporter